jgi:hypothetical protein
MDQFAAAIARDGVAGPCRLSVSTAAGPDLSTALTLSGPRALDASWLAQDLSHRLQIGLRALYGPWAALHIGGADRPDAPALWIALRHHAPPVAQVPDPPEKVHRNEITDTTP